MSRLDVWQAVPVNKSNRPVLMENEFNIYLKDNVGMYQGKLKIANLQNGRVYLTNRRIIYIDSAERNTAVAVNLADVLRAEYVERFLRSSPKVKVFLRDDRGVAAANTNTEISGKLQVVPSLPDRLVDWICVFCSFNNHISCKVDLAAETPKCTSCGVTPPRKQIEKALQSCMDASGPLLQLPEPANPDECPKCTFINHPSMKYCEMCGTALQTPVLDLANRIRRSESRALLASRAQNPLGLVLEEKEDYTSGKPYIKVSFRKGGDLTFYEHLVQEIDKIKWEKLENRGGISGDATKVRKHENPKIQSRGIHSLERIGELQRKQNEVLLTQSLEDLEQLMFKAQDLLKLSSSFGALVKRRKKQATTIPPLVINKSSSLYHQELARHISEYLLNSELTRITSMITLPDLFASYNRFRIVSSGFGTELITTQDMAKCMSLLDTLQLPIKKTTFQSGLEVVTQRSHELQDLHRAIMEYLVEQENGFTRSKYESEFLGENDDYTVDKYKVYHGNTTAEIALHFGWSHEVCAEEMLRCMDEQLVVWDRHILGTFYFVNHFDRELASKIKDDVTSREEVRRRIQLQQKSISKELKTASEADQRLVTLVSHDFGTLQEDVSSMSLDLKPETATSSLGELAGLQFE